MDWQQLAIFKLVRGSHASVEYGLCAMEAVAWLEGLEHSDRPACTCPVIGAYVRALNDQVHDEERQRLIPYLPRLVGTVSPDYEWARARYLVSQSLGRAWPIALRLVNLEMVALELEAMGKQWEDAPRARVISLSALADRAARATHFRDDPLVCFARAALADIATSADLADLSIPAASAHLADLGTLAARPAGVMCCRIYLEMLDGVLAIGPLSQGFSRPIEPRVQAYRELISA